MGCEWPAPSGRKTPFIIERWYQAYSKWLSLLCEQVSHLQLRLRRPADPLFALVLSSRSRPPRCPTPLSIAERSLRSQCFVCTAMSMHKFLSRA